MLATRVPDLPMTLMDITWSLPVGGSTITCGSDPGDYYTTAQLQTAINACAPGDVLILRAGDTFQVTGNLTLPALSNPGGLWIYIISSAYLSLGTIHRRRGSADSANMAKIEFQGLTNRIDTEWNAGVDRANYWRLMGLEVTGIHNTTSGTHTGLLTIGRYASAKPAAEADQPHHFIIDRCWIHGLSGGNYGYGIEFSGSDWAVVSCSIEDCHITNAESQGIVVAQGTGNGYVYNTKCEAAGIGMLVGGSTQQISNENISDITCERCYFTKDTAWRDVDTWMVKGCFETKGGVRLRLIGCEFGPGWNDLATGGQDGPIVSLKIANTGSDPWVDCSDVTFDYCLLRHGLIGVKLTGKDNANACDNGLSDVRFRHCIIDDINQQIGLGNSNAGTLIEFNGTGESDHPNTARITFEKCILLHDGLGQTDRSGSKHIYMNSGQKKLDMFRYVDCIASHVGGSTTNKYGIKRDGGSTGEAGLNEYCNVWDVRGNIWIHQVAGSYPSGNTHYVASLAAMNFADYANTDTDVRGYRLTATSPGYRSAIDGRDAGPDVDGVYNHTLHCQDGDWS